MNRNFSDQERSAKAAGIEMSDKLPFAMSFINPQTNQEQLQILVSHFEERVCEISSSGVFTYLGKAFPRLLGYTFQELLEKPILDIVHPDDRTQAVDSFHCAMDASTSIDQLRIQHKDGRWLWFEITSQGYINSEGEHRIVLISQDISQRKQFEAEREVTLRLLEVTNNQTDLHALMQSVTEILQQWTGCTSVGVRLHDGIDYPYFETRGFPSKFVEMERYLCVKAKDGRVERDAHGDPFLECMCGNIIRRRTDPSKPFFTLGGSFWSNCTTRLLASTTETDRQSRTRNRCNGEGYESVALIPLRTGGETFGLMQFNDFRPGMFTLDMIEVLERLAENLAASLAQRKAEEKLLSSLHEKETLLRELYHRTKNNMQVISSLLELESIYSQDDRVTRIIRSTQSRIQAMALVHQKLYQSQNLSRISLDEYLTDLAYLLLQTYSLYSQGVYLDTDLAPETAVIDIAIPCGLLVNELITNALKHAFPPESSGKGADEKHHVIHVQLHRLPDQRLELIVEDNGIGFPPGFDVRRSESMGMQTILTIGERQLGGKLTFVSDHGLRCSLVFNDDLYAERV
jgi:PAS domain S-box-containing protein